MKTQILLTLAAVALTTVAFSASANDRASSPRAQANQIKVVSSAAENPAITVAYVTPAAPAQLSPRAQANQIKVVSGVNTERNPFLECRSGMTGSPKAVAACSENPAMPSCVTVAPLK